MIFCTEERKRAEPWPGRTGVLCAVLDRVGTVGADATCEKLLRLDIGFAAASSKSALGEEGGGRPEIAAGLRTVSEAAVSGVGGRTLVEGGTFGRCNEP